jgi:hypothetical protein
MTKASNPNTNCLEDIECPRCANTSRFTIEALVAADVQDDGAEFVGDAYWDDESRIACHECEHTGKLGEFKADAIAAKRQLIEALESALLAFNVQPRFRVRETDSYAIAVKIEAALKAARETA